MNQRIHPFLETYFIKGSVGIFCPHYRYGETGEPWVVPSYTNPLFPLNDESQLLFLVRSHGSRRLVPLPFPLSPPLFLLFLHVPADVSLLFGLDPYPTEHILISPSHSLGSLSPHHSSVLGRRSDSVNVRLELSQDSQLQGKGETVQGQDSISIPERQKEIKGIEGLQLIIGEPFLGIWITVQDRPAGIHIHRYLCQLRSRFPSS